jgi:hypothetical protein
VQTFNWHRRRRTPSVKSVGSDPKMRIFHATPRRGYRADSSFAMVNWLRLLLDEIKTLRAELLICFLEAKIMPGCGGNPLFGRSSC